MPMFPSAPAPETPAQRYARDVTAQRGDNNDSVLNMSTGVWSGGDGTLTYVAPTAVGGRVQREFTARRGDWYNDADGDLTYDQYGRNSREYANRSTLVSAVNGQVYDGAHLLQGSPVTTPS